MINVEREFARLYNKAPSYGKLAVLCMLYVGADRNKGNISKETDAAYFNEYLKGHTNGEYKRAIKTLREQQSTLAACNNGDTSFFEETIAFIRRELLGKGAAA